MVVSWDFDFKTSDQGLAAYIAANDPIPEERQVALMGYGELIRKSGIMTVVLKSGRVRRGDCIKI